ncbi:cell envelope integrity protein CreD [Maricurvus nonylphenolicus]|uniref:cell envelope integrity protein CreD n=1 Tax=Maricurvus nonylphenolicus TaxID=1008307 RepID=UPI0036F3F7DC
MQKQLALKIVIIFAIGMLVLIPTSMVQYKIYERQGYLEQAKSSVAQSWTGSQLIVSPVLVIPYRVGAAEKSGFYSSKELQQASAKTSQRFEIVVPDNLQQQFTVTNSSVFKGIYEVPVYGSSLSISGAFSEPKLQQALAKIKRQPRFVDINEPYLSLHIADMRGIDQTPELTLNGSAVALSPGSQIDGLASGLHSALGGMDRLAKTLEFSLDFSLRGMGSFSFMPLADEATSSMQSNWPHPEFIGASLPKTREITAAGFTASWKSSRFSGYGADLMSRCAGDGHCESLRNAASGVSFIQPVDIYLQSERSIKYAMLFIGLSFITFFIFEHITRQPIHPIQYAFVGLAISVFYLLLISLAEHIAFIWAYTIGVLCCSSLLLFYVRYMLRSLRSAVLFSAMIVALYGVLYVIVQAEDYALLMGSILVFLVLTVLMYVTRNIDWYSIATPEQSADEKNAKELTELI